MDTPPELIAYQKTHWDPHLSWFAQRFAVKLRVTNALVADWNVRKDNDLSRILAFLHSGGTDVQPHDTRQQVTAEAERRACWYLVPFAYAADCVKSAVLMFALADGRINIEDSIRLSQL